MGYVNYRNPIHRTGFRPYGLTNAWAATQLSGVADSSEGMGGNYPFSAGGGWHLGDLGEELGDLGAAVPDQSIVTYTGTWSTTYFKSAQDIITAVSDALAADGLAVRSSSSNAGFLDSTILGMTIHPGPFQVRLQIQVENGMGYASPSDIASIVNHEVYAATGAMPTGSSIPTVQAPAGPAQATGQPDTSGAVPGGVQDWSAWLQQNAVWIGLAVAGMVIGPTLARRLL